MYVTEAQTQKCLHKTLHILTMISENTATQYLTSP